jgi:ceramide glucosyltransferase
MPIIHHVVTAVGIFALIFAAGYSSANMLAVIFWRRGSPTEQGGAWPPPVSLLKPLCGAEPGLYEQLRSFVRQDHADFQVIFGVRDRADPACVVVDRLMAEFPLLPIELVINPQLHGSNFKVSNLINMLPAARHDILVMADSDATVKPDYLTYVCSHLADPRVGLVTCAYQGIPTNSIWSRLGAMYVNEWYMPSVLLTALFGYQGYVSGQTVCIRRATLDQIGGLSAIANDLADDYKIGELVRNLGLEIVLSSYLVAGEHHEPRLESLLSHEVRWMSTIRVLRPRSFRWMFLTFTLPLAGLGLILSTADVWTHPVAPALFWTTVAARLVLHFVHRIGGRRALLADLWLVPVRDLLLCVVWCRSFFTSRVRWRGGEFAVDARGVMRRLS